MPMTSRLLRLSLAAGFTFSAQVALAEDQTALPPADAPSAPLTAPVVDVPAVASVTSAAVTAQPGAAAAVSPQQLVQQVNIPYQTFTLANGLRVIVHEDHK